MVPESTEGSKNPRRQSYGYLKALGKNLAFEDYWNGEFDDGQRRGDFYLEQIDLLSKLLENVYGSEIGIVGVENLEAVWYYVIRRFGSLVSFIEAQVIGDVGQQPKKINCDDAIWSFVVFSLVRNGHL